jgi:hypothetical protein
MTGSNTGPAWHRTFWSFVQWHPLGSGHFWITAVDARCRETSEQKYEHPNFGDICWWDFARHWVTTRKCGKYTSRDSMSNSLLPSHQVATLPESYRSSLDVLRPVNYRCFMAVDMSSFPSTSSGYIEIDNHPPVLVSHASSLGKVVAFQLKDLPSNLSIL